MNKQQQKQISGLSNAVVSAIVGFMNQKPQGRDNTGDNDNDNGWKKLHGKAKSGIQVNSCSGKVIDGGDHGLLRDSSGRPLGHGKLTIKQLAEIEVGARELADMMKSAKGTKPRRRIAKK